ncbi:uncharacterized protein N7459_009458 [Penicillium hispanicum]|uniref:uncharacterized protein n=1 Tax=Penicillium hispanicum TaxID=1080232 RepID=UPI00253F7868|nr:uncharacterized protein N7459_009458 [Penicillium hispanicum]KAJ5570028.1 hypothetical protein N7459_009458 [Penicillium hispanicum]
MVAALAELTVDPEIWRFPHLVITSTSTPTPRLHLSPPATMLLFGLGNLVYVIILIINAIAVLSEDRFLARIGWGRTQAEPSFGTTYDSNSVKAKSINLIASVRTVMRSTFNLFSPSIKNCLSPHSPRNEKSGRKHPYQPKTRREDRKLLERPS